MLNANFPAALTNDPNIGQAITGGSTTGGWLPNGPYIYPQPVAPCPCCGRCPTCGQYRPNVFSPVVYCNAQHS